MKTLFLFFSLLFIFAASSCTSSKDWLWAEKSEFENLYQYFDTVKDIKLDTEIKRSALEGIVPNTFTTGVWWGYINDVKSGYFLRFQINISQIQPLIIGTFRISEYGEKGFTGNLRGRIKDDDFIAACQLKGEYEGEFFSLEGKCLRVSKKDFQNRNEIEEVAIGNFKANHNILVTIGNFILKKENKYDDDPYVEDLVNRGKFNYFFMNALLPPNYPIDKTLIDYTASPSSGLAIMINDSSSFQYKNVLPFTVLPTGEVDTENVFEVTPKTIPSEEHTYIKLVKPIQNSDSPGVLDTNLFHFNMGSLPLHPRNERTYAIIVFDTVKKNASNVARNISPYDSGSGVYAVPLPVNVIRDSARIVLGYMLAAPAKPLKITSNNKARFFVNDISYEDKIGLSNKKLGSQTKTIDSSTVVSPGKVTLRVLIGHEPENIENYSFTFTAKKGAIYAAFIVGQRGRTDGKYGPRFMVVRVNPKH